MNDDHRELIASARRGALDERLRVAAARMGADEPDEREVRHIERILTSPALVLTTVLDLLRFGDLVDTHLYPTALRALSGDQANDVALHRVLTVPDHVRILGDKCLFETGIVRGHGPSGLDLGDLGRRSYLKAARILDTLSEDPRLRRFYEQDAMQHASIDDEVAFLARCAERFGVHVNLLEALLFTESGPLLSTSLTHADRRDEPSGGTDPATEACGEPVARAPSSHAPEAVGEDVGEDVAEAAEEDVNPATTEAKAGTALARQPPAPLDRPRGDRGEPSDEAASGRPNLHIVARSEEEIREQQVRDLIAAERTVLFSALDPEHLRDELKRLVVQQEEAIDSLCDELSLYSTGTQDPRKPASYFLVGPTGVGKNHLVETLCRLFQSLWGIEVPYLEIEGPEFTYPSDINELKGAARGFIRSDEEGIMTQFHERAHDKPFSVILVDEVEKAHPQLRRFFLPIIDRGTMMDNRGRVLHFTNTTIFFTSNLGYSDASQRAQTMGFGDEQSVERAYDRDVVQNIRRALSPEFINRVHLLHFRHLGEPAVDRIFDLELDKIRERYRDAQGLDLEVSDAARQELLVRGYSREYGARNLAKVLNRHANIEVSKSLKRDESRQPGDVGDVLGWLRDMREGKIDVDLEEVRAQVNEFSKIQVPYRSVLVDFVDGDFRYEKRS